VNLVPPKTDEKLRATLHAKAKRSSDHRLYYSIDGWTNWRKMPETGSVSGCVESTRCRVGGTHASPTSICTGNWDWSSSACVTATFRGRTHESLSESRMRESARPV
jgi:hypothetical protein